MIKLHNTIITFSVLLFVLIGTSLSFAQNNSEENTKYITKILENADFEAKLNGNNVKITWDSQSADFINDSEWNYWKIVRSGSNSNPVYPEDGYIKYDASKRGFNSYVDTKPKKGLNYYRVCAIANYIRYCSNVIKIEIKHSDETKADKQESKQKDSSGIVKNRATKQEKSKNLLTDAQINLINKKLDEIPNEKKLEFFNKLIIRIDELSLKYSTKSKLILQEIKAIIQDRIIQIDSSSLIDDIFTGIDK